MRALLLTGLLGCTLDKVAPVDDSGGADSRSDHSGTGDDSGVDSGVDSDDSGPSVCPQLYDIEVSGLPEPGGTLGLLVTGIGPATLSWTVSDGSLDADDSANVTWSLPDPHHVNLDLTATVIASAPGCPDVAASTSLNIGWSEADRVIVLYDPLVSGSEEVALAYAEFREIPESQLCPVTSTDTTTISGAEYDLFAATVQVCIDDIGERVEYIVPVYGVPYRVSDRIDDIASGSPTTTSLDALLVFGEAGLRYGRSFINPLWQHARSSDADYDPYVPFGPWQEERDKAYYMVSRIDGADADQALALIERTRDAEALAAVGGLDGIVYVDGRYGDVPPTTDSTGSYESGEWDMWGMRRIFEGLGWYEVVWDGNDAEFGTAPAPTECPDALYYAGWYSVNNYNDCFDWAPGAVGGHLDSYSALDIRSGTCWAHGALLDGITATFGAVNEPYVSGMPGYDQLFLYLTQGANFGEASYESTRLAAWMMLFVGDPLYRPYPG